MPKPKKNESKQDYLKRCTAQVVSEGNDAKKAYAMCNGYWDKEKKQRSALSLTTAPEIIELKDDKKRREFLITAYTGKTIKSWWSDLVIDISGIQTKEKMPVLREHARDRVVGYGDAWKEDNFYISGVFSESTEDAREVLALAQEGYPWQASISVRALKVEELKDDKTKAVVNGETVTGPLEIWRESKVGEVSFVTLGADDDTAAITMSEEKFEVEVIQIETSTSNDIKITEKKEDVVMKYETMKADFPELLAEIELASEKNGIEKGIAQERDRVTKIMGIDGDPEVAKKAIRDGLSVDASYRLFFEAEKKKKADAIKDLEKEAPDSVGAEEPPVKLPEKNEAPDVKLSRLAIELMTKENIEFAEAAKRVMQENPELKAAYEATYDVD